MTEQQENKLRINIRDIINTRPSEERLLGMVKEIQAIRAVDEKEWILPVKGALIELKGRFFNTLQNGALNASIDANEIFKAISEYFDKVFQEKVLIVSKEEQEVSLKLGISNIIDSGASEMRFIKMAKRIIENRSKIECIFIPSEKAAEIQFKERIREICNHLEGGNDNWTKEAIFQAAEHYFDQIFVKYDMNGSIDAKSEIRRKEINVNSLKSIALYLEGIKQGKGGNILPLGNKDLEDVWDIIKFLQGDDRYQCERLKHN